MPITTFSFEKNISKKYLSLTITVTALIVFLQRHTTKTYTGTLFPSILHSSRGKKRSHYTPRPLLNPVRRGKGLYSSVQLLLHTEAEAALGEEEDEGGVLP